MCGTAYCASAAQSLGFVVWMPVILLLVCFSLSSIYRAVFTASTEDSKEDLLLAVGMVSTVCINKTNTS